MAARRPLRYLQSFHGSAGAREHCGIVAGQNPHQRPLDLPPVRHRRWEPVYGKVGHHPTDSLAVSGRLSQRTSAGAPCHRRYRARLFLHVGRGFDTPCPNTVDTSRAWPQTATTASALLAATARAQKPSFADCSIGRRRVSIFWR